MYSCFLFVSPREGTDPHCQEYRFSTRQHLPLEMFFYTSKVLMSLKWLTSILTTRFLFSALRDTTSTILLRQDTSLCCVLWKTKQNFETFTKCFKVFLRKQWTTTPRIPPKCGGGGGKQKSHLYLYRWVSSTWQEIVDMDIFGRVVIWRWKYYMLWMFRTCRV
jgi:hypothetical protein